MARIVIPYHGGPITPESAALVAWKRRHAFISFYTSRQIGLAAEICRSFAIDNGAFAAWKSGKPVTDWRPYYAFVADWRRHPRFDFAVIPDVIEGTEQENDDLIEEWQFPFHEGAPVWHTNESVERLQRLASRWPRICIGSSGEYDVRFVRRFLDRMREVLPAICDRDGFPVCKLHGLRMLNPAIFTQLPLSSGDAATVGRNIGLDSRWKGTYQPASKELRAAVLIDRIEQYSSACRLGGTL